MSVTKAEFKQIFTAAVAQEFCHIPGAEKISYTFSQAFLRRKEKLIKNTRKTTWYWVNTAAKRAAVIVLLLAMLFSVAMSVEAIRDPVVTFFTELYEKYILIVFEGDGYKEIEQEYGFTQLPEGYEIVDVARAPAIVITTLQDAQDNLLVLEQSIAEGDGPTVDNEQGVVTQVSIGETSVLVYEAAGTKGLLWTRDGYFFSLFSFGDMQINNLLTLVETIK